MGPLKNSRHEAFCRAIVQGAIGREAYAAAGYKAKPAAADTNAGRLLKNAEVSARIAELKAEAAAGAVMSGREVLEELSKLGRSNMADVVHITVATDIVEAVKGLPPEHAAAIQELTVESYEEHDPEGADEDATRVVKRVKFKLHDKRGSLNDLGRYHKLFKGADEAPPVAGKGDDAAALTDLELARRIAFALESAARSVEKAATAITPKADTPAEGGA